MTSTFEVDYVPAGCTTRFTVTCLRESYCSYLAATYDDMDVTVLSDYLQFDIDAVTNLIYEFEDGSALYGDAVCPVTDCAAVSVGVFIGNSCAISKIVCPVGTVMEWDIRRESFEGFFQLTPAAGVEALSIPAGCTGGTTINCGISQGPYKIQFAPGGIDCTATECDYPTNGFAYGNCESNTLVCNRRTEAADVIPPPTMAPVTSAPVTSAPVTSAPSSTSKPSGAAAAAPSSSSMMASTISPWVLVLTLALACLRR